MNTPLPSLAAKIAYLSQAGSYPGSVHRVACIETHMSCVFLAGSCAYKLKKPVRTDLADFQTLQARHQYCKEELRLNRRLAASIYLALVPLVLDGTGHLHLGGQAVAVDWLIKMRRVPAWLMLDCALAQHSATSGDADRVARTLARFHQSLPPERMAPAAYRRRFARQIAANRAELRDPVYRSSPARIDMLCDTQARALAGMAALLEARCLSGHLVEGHGDLRPEHICLLREIAVIDCLEFSRELRVLDKADEVGYLALECERLGAPAMAETLTVAYQNYCSDHPPARLIHFYQSCRASQRALLAVRHLREEKFRFSAHWQRTASAYLTLALAHAKAAHAA